MNISDVPNNCGLVAFHQIIPDRSEAEIITACYEAGFDPDMGMFPHHIEDAATALKLKWTKWDDPVKYDGQNRYSLTLNQALYQTAEEVCLIRLNGHVIASNRSIPLDVNVKRRGARRRVLGIYVIHNATIAPRKSWDISRDPELQFVHDITRDTQKGSYRASVYHKVMTHEPVLYSELKSLGYTRKMLKRHIERGDAIILNE